MSKWSAFTLGLIQVIIGLNGVAGGLELVLEPSGAKLGFQVERLVNSPFSDFLIPGIFLLVINGIGSLLGSVASFRRYRFAGEIAVGLGSFLIIWIIAQVWWIGFLHWLQPLFFCIGVIELSLGLLLRRTLQTVR